MHPVDTFIKEAPEGHKLWICKKEGQVSCYLIKNNNITEFLIKYNNPNRPTISTNDYAEIVSNWDRVWNDNTYIGGHKQTTANAVRRINGLDNEPLIVDDLE